MELPTNPGNFVRIAQGIRNCGGFIFLNFVKFNSLGKPHSTPAPAPMMVKFGVETHRGATCRPCGAKRFKLDR